MQGLSHPAIDEICDESVHTELGDTKDESSIESEIAHIKSLNVKKT